jgi:hypothetical protein
MLKHYAKTPKTEFISKLCNLQKPKGLTVKLPWALMTFLPTVRDLAFRCMRPTRDSHSCFALSYWSGQLSASPAVTEWPSGLQPVRPFVPCMTRPSRPYGGYNRSASPLSCQCRRCRLCSPEPQDPVAPLVVLLDDSHPGALPRTVPPPSRCPAACFAQDALGLGGPASACWRPWTKWRPPRDDPMILEILCRLISMVVIIAVARNISMVGDEKE